MLFVFSFRFEFNNVKLQVNKFSDVIKTDERKLREMNVQKLLKHVTASLCVLPASLPLSKAIFLWSIEKIIKNRNLLVRLQLIQLYYSPIIALYHNYLSTNSF